MTLKKLIFLIISAFLLTNRSSAETPHHFDVVQGAYNHLLTTMHRHSNGLIWVGTSTGLCRYDGYSILPASVILNDTSSFINDYILKISEDSKGRLWIKTQGRYGIYDPTTHTISENISDIFPKAKIEGRIIELEADADGGLWIATDEDALYYLPVDADTAQKVDGFPNKDYKVTTIAMKDGLAVCADQSGALTWIDPATMDVTRQASPPGLPGKFGKQDFQLTIDRNGRYWVYCTFSIEVYDDNTKTWISDQIPDKDRNGNIRNIYQDKVGYLWIARDNHGLERVVTDSEGIHFVTSDSPDGITHKNTITCFMEDTHGSRWLGTYKMGLLSYHDCVHKFSIDPLPDVNVMIPADGT